MEKLVIAGREFNSRLFLGTGKFNNNALMAEAIKASETEMVTVAMKRIELARYDQQAGIERHSANRQPHTRNEDPDGRTEPAESEQSGTKDGFDGQVEHLPYPYPLSGT